jgi:hypothetical protein
MRINEQHPMNLELFAFKLALESPPEALGAMYADAIEKWQAGYRTDNLKYTITILVMAQRLLQKMPAWVEV